MNTNLAIQHALGAVLFLTSSWFAWTSRACSQDAPTAPPKQEESAEAKKLEAKTAAGFKEFQERVDAYVKLHKSVAGSLPNIKPTTEPQKITDHQRELAQKIREARPHARRGDIFTEDAREAFRRVIKAEFQGPHGRGARRTIRQGEPLTKVHLRVNQSYPDGVPFTTLPPSLLLKFPKLPEQVAYRIVVHDLVLIDVEANLVVDRIPEIIPNNL
jgi:hypothetical protein